MKIKQLMYNKLVYYTAAVILILSLLFIVKTPAYAQTIKINEFSSAAGTTSDPDWPDWVEVYYIGVDTALYQLRDAANNTKNLSDATCSSNFCAVGWSNRLNNAGDTIKLVLISTPDTVIDQITYGTSGDVAVPSTGQSAGRSNDSTGGWVIFSTPTKGSTNNTATPAPTSTPTLTPTPTSSPTNTPTSTKTPTPTPTKTSAGGTTQASTPIPTKTSIPTPTQTKNKVVTKLDDVTSSAGEAGIVLSQNISTQTATPSETPTAGFVENNLPKIMIVVGGIFLVLCGTLFFKWKKESG